MRTDYLISPSQIFLFLLDVHFNVKELDKVATDWVSSKNTNLEG